jgi:hypothetical protein
MMRAAILFHHMGDACSGPLEGQAMVFAGVELVGM